VYADTTIRKGVPLPETWRTRIGAFERVAPIAA
jgi:hypothetical protein